MKFFSSFYNSLFNVAWLKEQSVVPKKAWSYFLLFIALINLSIVIPLAFEVSPALKQVSQLVNEKIPENFTARLQNGALSVSGIAQPFIFKDETNNRVVVVVDTVSTTSLALQNYLTSSSQNGVLIDKQKVEFFDAERGQSQIQYWRDIPEFAINKNTLRAALQKVGPSMLVFVFVVVLIILYIGIGISKLWSIFLVSIIVFILGMVMGKKWQFGHLFTVGLYAITLPSLISLIFTILGVRIPYVHFLALLAFMIAVVLTRPRPGLDANKDVLSSDNSGQGSNLGA